MTILEKAVSERIEEFRNQVMQYRREENITIEDLAIDAEIGTTTMTNFFGGRHNLSYTTALKISYATGIAL